MPKATDKKLSARRMLKAIRITLPLVRPILWQHKSYLLFFFLFSILLGVIPTLKSELESGILDQAARYLSSIKRDDPDITFSRLAHDPLARFASNEPKKDSDLIEDLARIVFSKVGLISALWVYFGLALTAYLITA